VNRFPGAFWTAVVAGWAIMAFGVWGLFMDANQTNPTSWVKWFLGGAIVHDLVVVPVVLLVGTVVARAVPLRWRAPVQGALISSALVVATFAIFVSGAGDISENPSALPNSYALGLVVLLGFIWACALVWAIARRDASTQAPESN